MKNRIKAFEGSREAGRLVNAMREVRSRLACKALEQGESFWWESRVSPAWPADVHVEAIWTRSIYTRQPLPAMVLASWKKKPPQKGAAG